MSVLSARRLMAAQIALVTAATLVDRPGGGSDAAPCLHSGPCPTASLATALAGLDVNERRGDPADLDAVAAYRWEEGVYVTLAAYPLVPRDRVGFRIQLTAFDSDHDVDRLNSTPTRLSGRFPLRLKGWRAMTTHNDDVDWDRWPVADYLRENYREVHPSDAAVIAHHSAFYRRFRPGAIARSVEFGAGPNLYPLILASAVSRGIDAVEAGAGNVAYLQDQICHRLDASWLPFHALCRRLNPDVPATLAGALAHVNVVHADVRTLPAGSYQLASMHFVAEGATEDFAEFADFCRTFVRTVEPGGHLVAAFMENMPTYRIGPASRWPGCPVSPATVTDVFTPVTRDLDVTRIDADPTLPDYGDSGMVLLTGVAEAV